MFSSRAAPRPSATWRRPPAAGDLQRQCRRMQPQQHLGKIVQQRGDMDHRRVGSMRCTAKPIRRRRRAVRSVSTAFKPSNASGWPARRIHRRLRPEGAEEGRDAQQHQRGGDGFGVGGAARRHAAAQHGPAVSRSSAGRCRWIRQQVRIDCVLVGAQALQRLGRAGQHRKRRGQNSPPRRPGPAGLVAGAGARWTCVGSEAGLSVAYRRTGAALERAGSAARSGSRAQLQVSIRPSRASTLPSSRARYAAWGGGACARAARARPGRSPADEGRPCLCRRCSQRLAAPAFGRRRARLLICAGAKNSVGRGPGRPPPLPSSSQCVPPTEQLYAARRRSARARHAARRRAGEVDVDGGRAGVGGAARRR